MSNQHNEQAFENIMQEIEQLDRKNMIEDDVQSIARAYGLHEDDDRDEILFHIAEKQYENNLHKE